MHFLAFNAATTNIFPAVNTTQGGQLMTEFNIRSVDTVSTDPNIQYSIGPSFVHDLDSFSLSHDELEENSILTIAPGRAVVNGHYVESLTPIKIDIQKGNAWEVNNGGVNIRGKLCVGLRMMYSTNTSLVGTLDSEGNYEGVQIIVLPESEFRVPGQDEDTKANPDKVTAHIKLGEFTYRNSKIKTGSIVNNLDKVRYIDPCRIKNLDDELGEDYFTKRGLKQNTLYSVATKFESNEYGTNVEANFCESLDSLMKWDSKPEIFGVSGNEELRSLLKNNPSARFLSSSDGKRVFLFLPHKQVDSNSTKEVKDTDYKPIMLDIPVASLTAGTPGVVDVNYSAGINAILNKLNEYYHLPYGSQLAFIDSLADRQDLPPIPTKANVGDYIIVRNDMTIQELDNEYSWPSTMYAVVPGIVKQIKYISSSNAPSGIEIASTFSSDIPITDNKNEYNTRYWNFAENKYRGVAGEDYFTYYYVTQDEHDRDVEIPYYYIIEYSQPDEWSDPIIITGQIPLAEEELVGGFYNVPVSFPDIVVDDAEEESFLDCGYVALDGKGRLRLVDYSLLRQGTLAYQLGSDFERTGLTLEELQDELDNFVNERIAFPNLNSKASESHITNVTIELPNTEEGGVIEIRGIDSRFNTCIYLHILGEASSNTIVRLIDCEKLMIDSSIHGEPTIELYRCNLFYDAYVIDRLSKIKDMTLWYERFSEDAPNLVVDNMTVKELEAAIPVADIDYWSTSNSNDVHYQTALQSISFDNDGNVVGIGLYVRDCSTRDEIPEGKHILTSSFELPQGSGLLYPPSRFTKKLKVDGTFVSAYVPSNQDAFQIYVANISFSAVTDVFNADISEDVISGKISFYDDSCVVESIGGEGAIITGDGVDIPGINTDEFHIFTGGVIG